MYQGVKDLAIGWSLALGVRGRARGDHGGGDDEHASVRVHAHPELFLQNSRTQPTRNE